MRYVLFVVCSVFFLCFSSLAAGELLPADSGEAAADTGASSEITESVSELIESPVVEDAVSDSSSESVVSLPPSMDSSGFFSVTSEGVLSEPVYTEDNPLPVVVLEEESSYDAVRSGTYSIDIVIGDEPPSDPPFYGSGYVTGTSSTLGTVTLYFPIDYKAGTFGVDSNGYLFNVTSSSLSGYLAGVYNNSVSAPAFSYPRYRESSSYDYTTLYITPTDSNMEIATSNAPKYSVIELIPYLAVVLLGGVFLCCMRRS